jgi:acyl-CoA reductase-like NAD-dependent aldehyde dehydrogenase
MMDELLLINGERRAATGGATFERFDPYTGKLATLASAATVADAVAAADGAAEAFRTWADTPPRQRRDLLLRASEVIETKAGDFARLMTAEIGATAAWARFNVMMASGMLREAAAQVYNVKGEILPSDAPDVLSMGLRVPAGVVLSIAPWNAPLVLAMRAMAFPVAYGNTVVLKASELSPATHLALGDVFTDAGFPPGVVNVISNDRAQAPAIVEALIAHRAVRRVNFTGSTPVGRIVGELSGRHLKPSLLELGGKNPLIVLDDADLDYAVRAAAFGAFANNGQACMASNRIIVQRSIAETFVERLSAHAATLRVGDPRDPATRIGPLADPSAPARVSGLIEDARKNGANVTAGGTNEGAVFTSTVLSGVNPDMDVYHQEIFGPVAPVTFVDSVDEAIDMANDTTFGLSAGILTRDHEKGLAIARSLHTGMAHVNDQSVNDEPHVPFGGVGDSGYGRFGGEASIHEFTELRWTTVRHRPRQFHM